MEIFTSILYNLIASIIYDASRGRVDSFNRYLKRSFSDTCKYFSQREDNPVELNREQFERILSGESLFNKGERLELGMARIDIDTLALHFATFSGLYMEDESQLLSLSKEILSYFIGRLEIYLLEDEKQAPKLLKEYIEKTSDENLKRSNEILDVINSLENELLQVNKKIDTFMTVTDNPTNNSSLVVRDGKNITTSNKFYGRSHDITKLVELINSKNRKIIIIHGTGGIGKTELTKGTIGGIGKSELIGQVLNNEKEDLQQFKKIPFIDLKSPATEEEIIEKMVQFLSEQKETGGTRRFEKLMALLQSNRYLIVFDNLESILATRNNKVDFKDNYQQIKMLVDFIIRSDHESCLCFTTRVIPEIIEQAEITEDSVSMLSLEGLQASDCRKIFEDRAREFNENFHYDDGDWERLASFYGGNPLYMKIIANAIAKDKKYPFSVTEFIRNNEKSSGTLPQIQDILDEQFNVLTPLEKEIFFWLVIERVEVSGEKLKSNIADDSIPIVTVVVSVNSLSQKMVIERVSVGSNTPGKNQYFTLQPVIMEYATAKLLNEIDQGFLTNQDLDKLSPQYLNALANELIADNPEKLYFLRKNALLKATSEDHIRSAQKRLIIDPLWKKLLQHFNNETQITEQFKNLLERFVPEKSRQYGYAAGNIFNILGQSIKKIEGFNAQSLLIKQGYFQGIAVHDSDFSNAVFEDCHFNDSFGSITSVAFNHNGKYLAVGEKNNKVYLWNVENFHKMIFPGHNSQVMSLDFKPGEDILVSGDQDGYLLVRDIHGREKIEFFKGHELRIRQVSFNKEGDLLATCSEDGLVKIWETDSYTLQQELRHNAHHDLKGKYGISTIAFSPCGKYLAGGGYQNIIYYWRLEDGEILKTFTGHEKWIWSLTFNHDGTRIISGSEDATIRIWNVEEVNQQGMLTEHSEAVFTIAYYYDTRSGEEYIASGSEDKTLRFWKWNATNEYQCMATFTGHTNRVRSAAFNADGTLIATGSFDESVRLWSTEHQNSLKTLSGYSNWVWSLAFSPDDRYLISGSQDKSVRLWDMSRPKGEKYLGGEQHDSWVLTTAFDPDNKTIATGSEDGKIRLFSVQHGRFKKLNTLRGHDSWVWAIDFSADGTKLVSCSEDKNVLLWDIKEGKANGSHCDNVNVHSEHQDRIHTVKFNKDATQILSGGYDNKVILWNVQQTVQDRAAGAKVSKDKDFYMYDDHHALVMSVAFNRDDTVIASCDEEGVIIVRDLNGKGSPLKLTDHQGKVWDVAFHPSRDILVSAGNDNNIMVWESTTGILKTTLRHEEAVLALAFSHDGRLLASGDKTGKIKLWEIGADEWTFIEEMQAPRLYEGMNITEAQGLDTTQERSLENLGAFTEDHEIGKR